MIFAEKSFLVFLPIVLFVYHVLPTRKWKYHFLLFASWYFYSLFSVEYLWVIISITLLDYWAGLNIERSNNEKKRRRWLAMSIISNLGLLFSFKYTVFVYDNALALSQVLGFETVDRTWEILLPLGISFHTFQGISYTVDVYRRQIRAVQSLSDYALFVTFFPQLAAGPIVRACEFLPQMMNPPAVTAEKISQGLRLVVLGLMKKLLIADQLHSVFVEAVFSAPENYSASTLCWAALAWTIQIYCDFSGYTDIAIGIGLWFGFHLPDNFNLPLLATSITDFWRRWHMSLSSWLRDYLYFPLGGSRHGTLRTYLNLLLIFILCGLWHGASWNWLIYGLFNGLLMGLHRFWTQVTAASTFWTKVRHTYLWTGLSWVLTLYQLTLGLILIRMPDWNSGWYVIRALLGMGHHTSNFLATDSSRATGVPLMAILLMAWGMVEHLYHLLIGRTGKRVPVVLEGLFLALLFVLVLVVGSATEKSFIYIQF